LVLYTLGIPFMAALRNVAAVFYAFKDAKTPMYASFASIGLNIVLNLSLMWSMGFLAFPLSTAVSAVLNVAVLFVLLPNKIGKTDMRPMGLYFLALAAASVVGGAAGWFANGLILARLGHSFVASLASVLVCGLLGLAVFYAASRLLGITESREYLRRFLRR
ncbi:MAG TPA: lipid II flippase MurJ, partial [Acidobacteriota bacterium]|nr:lipid II flippase MurJ [Acidobacteriota bacterium]